MNKCILMGRLTKDAEIREAGSTTVVRFTLAVDRRFAKEDAKQTADFISCVAFGKTAEFIGKYGLKGTKFVVEGHIQTGSYTNNNGDTVYTTDVAVENVEFAESKKTSDSNSSSVTSADKGSAAHSESSVVSADDDDDFPFA
ncbi:MAG: single-stranded DNA-binding protein [[Eubacterium] siraeum]|jgi:single-strand DNA-binding protein